MATSIWFVNGSSRGVGLEFVKQLSTGSKNRVIAGARKPADSVGLQHLKDSASNVTLVQLDQTDPDSIQAAVKEVEAKFGKIDFLINNAGIMAGEAKMSFALDEPLEAIEEAFKVNVLGPLAVTRAFYPLLLKGTGKTVVNVSTAAASLNWHIAGVAEPNVDPMRASSVGYKMSKVALNLQSAVLANSVKQDGVKVISLHPGIVATELPTEATMGFPRAIAIPPAESVTGQLKLITSLKPEDSGKFFEYKGNPHPL